ncbi:arylamine N-acetyltransferase [Effusibacillus pohliae]|uniref:arylamine N-acetyltransferase n=1 Tax=Effusibacillus pohliae TaxID=232270 RepID=UPI0003808C1B|nr:arylamine N-acetyltransferase [Effusibacillus pohliae]
MIFKFYYYEHRQKNGWLIPPVETFVENLAERGWGGNCYILNFNFGELLQSLGFDAALIRVRPNHAAIMVTFEGTAYYVDVGYAAPLFHPVDLAAEPYLSAFDEEIFFKKLAERQFEINRKRSGVSFVTKQIEWTPLSAADFQLEVELSFQDTDDNLFMRGIHATLFQGGRCYTLRNDTLIVKHSTGSEEHRYGDREKWLAMVSGIFGFDRDLLNHALSFLEKRCLPIFK